MRKMTTQTIATLPRLSSTDLSRMILSHSSSNLDATPATASQLAIVDVRDDAYHSSKLDHIGGHIKNSIHAPSSTLDHKIPELVRKLKDKNTVVFHCALSQQRGPSAALRYIRERDRLLGLRTTNSTGSGARNMAEDNGIMDRTDLEEKKPEEQTVYVLDRGFVGWQERFGEDTRLTEGYRKEIWKDGYWM